jgi:hypothetical protein
MDSLADSPLDAFQVGTRGPLFFMHIPKTAGMSMRQYLNGQYHPSEICRAERWQDLLDGERDIGAYRLVRGHFRYNLRELLAPDTRMLVILRDPLRRTVSALRHLARDPHFHHTYELAKNFTLSEMIRHPGIMAYQRDVQARFLCAARPAADVTAALRRARSHNGDADAGDHEKPPTFEFAADRLETIAFVGLTEDLGSLVSTMAREMQFHPPRYFPFVNENPERLDPLRGLTEEELDIIREHNTIDSRLYDFARKLIDWRAFDRAMRRLVRGGIYQVPTGSFEIPLADTIPGSGWYAAETIGGISWRWTGPGRHCMIEVPLRHDVSYRFDMTFGDPRPSGPTDLAVEINDYPIPFEIWPEGELYRCVFVIEQALLEKSFGVCRIQIDTGETSQLSTSDLRWLGISVRCLEFICLDT